MNDIKFVADIGSNHNRNFARCLKLIDAAKDMGCWGVKIQIFQADKLYAKGYIPNDFERQIFPISWTYKVADYCKQKNIKFGGTPFDLEAARTLNYYADFMKISSFDILRLDLIKACIQPNKELIISTGMAIPEEILNTRKLINKNILIPKHIYYLHCISDYPTKPEDCKLGNIKALKNLFNYHEYYNTKVGWSDHTQDINTLYKAQMQGAEMIEFHIDLDDQLGYESINGHCYTPKMMGKTIYNILKIESTIDIQYWNPLTPEMINKRNFRADPADGLRPMRKIR